MSMRKSNAGGNRRVAVVDVGSNSVRLVMFEGLMRAPVPVFNENVLCALGRDQGTTGRLHKSGIEMAIAAIGRFAKLAEAMKVDRLEAVATAAVRDASDGPEFAAEVERRSGLKLRIISGKEEGRLSAEGVLSAFPGADGIACDLGGGSLEVVALSKGATGEQETLPLGPLRLASLDGRNKMKSAIEEALDRAPWLKSAGARRDLHAVGGAWRNIARVHMAQNRYPLHVIHAYAISAEEALEITEVMAHMSRNSLERIEGISAKLLESLPAAALVLRRLVKRAKPARVVFSAFGLREGLVFQALSDEVRALDPLIAAADQLVDAEGREPGLGKAVADWISPAFAGDSEPRRRLRQVAALLSDIGWREHPDYRADHAFFRTLRLPVVGIDHPGRVYLALAAYGRYKGDLDGSAPDFVRKLLDPEATRHALAVGQALRLAHTFSAGTTGILAKGRLERTNATLTLQIDRYAGALSADVVDRRLQALARTLDLKSRLSFGG